MCIQSCILISAYFVTHGQNISNVLITNNVYTSSTFLWMKIVYMKVAISFIYWAIVRDYFPPVHRAVMTMVYKICTDFGMFEYTSFNDKHFIYINKKYGYCYMVYIFAKYDKHRNITSQSDGTFLWFTL